MVKKKEQFYLVDVNSRPDGSIRIFGRTKKGEKLCVLEHFNPYFYVIVNKNVKKIEERIKNIRIKLEDRVITPLSTSVETKKFIGKKVDAIKVVLHLKKDLTEIKSAIKAIKEVESIQGTDVPLTKQYLVNKKIVPLTLCEVSGDPIRDEFGNCLKGRVTSVSTETIKPKVLAFDIETHNKGVVPSEGEYPILTIAFKGKNFEKIVSWNKFGTNDERIEFVKDEKALIEEFNNVVEKYDPDYLVGYFSDGFDFPYLKARANVFDVKLDVNVTRRLGVVKARMNEIVHLDIFKFIRYIYGGSLRIDSFSLGSVAKELINGEKLEVDASESSEIFENGTDKDKEEFCLYNLQDALLTYELFNKIEPNLNELVKLVGQPIFDVCRTSFGQLVEWYLIKRLDEFNEVCPNKPNVHEISGRRSQSFEGAYVLEPDPGVYDNIAVLDFRSVYPSIISAYNICPSTLTKNKEHAHESPDINGERFYFDYKEDGFMPKVITDLIQRRIRIKEIIKKEGKKDPILDARSYSLKILANAFYGYLGFFGARWYSLECARSITAFSRDYIQKTIEKAKKDGFNVIYADTDSIFLVLENKTKEDVKHFVKETNMELPSLMELELEDFYKRGLFVIKKDATAGAKKKYALMSYEGKIKIIGFETVRRDWSYIARDVQKNVINLILNGDEKKAREFLRETIKNIRENKIPLDKMVIQTQMKMNIGDYTAIGPHVAAARRMIKRGINVGPGSMIKYIITEGTGIVRDRARLIEEAENYDSEYYLYHQIVPAVEKIFEVLGYNKEDLLKDGEQSQLGEF